MIWISRSRCASALRSAFIAAATAGPMRELPCPGWSARNRAKPSCLFANRLCDQRLRLLARQINAKAVFVAQALQ